MPRFIVALQDSLSSSRMHRTCLRDVCLSYFSWNRGKRSKQVSKPSKRPAPTRTRGAAFRLRRRNPTPVLASKSGDKSEDANFHQSPAWRPSLWTSRPTALNVVHGPNTRTRDHRTKRSRSIHQLGQPSCQVIFGISHPR